MMRESNRNIHMSSNQVEAAKLIRKFIKEQKVSATVKSKGYAGGNSIYIHLKDANPEQYAIVQKEADQYEYGYFDGMTDSYVRDNVNKNIPQVSYVFVERDFSDEIRQKALDVLHAELPDDFVNVPKLYSEIGDLETDSSGDYIKPIIRKVLQNDYLYENLWKLVF